MPMPINWPWNCREETATLGTVAALPAGGGYGLIAPNGDGYWTAETYRFDPGTIVINQGDIVTLEIIGINGQAHPFAVEGYDVSGVVRRGEVTRVTFTADKAGTFRFFCAVHQPPRQGELVVLARP